MNTAEEPNVLRIRSIGINTYRENIIYMREDCPVCRSEGFTALTRLEVHFKGRMIIATLNVFENDLFLKHDEAALSTEAMSRLGVREGDLITVAHLHPVRSLTSMRAKMFGKELAEEEYLNIITDVVAGKYSNVELAAFVTACAGDNLKVNEIIGLTRAMILTGDKLEWGMPMVLDKHCVGGLPGNRTTPIVVSIVAALGLTIPKTSSRAITSPAGTADTLETMTNVNLHLPELQEVVRKTGACLAWGGAVRLSPADDILISVEKALDVDSEGQMIASVLSKKAAAGSTHVLIDIPVGPTAKVRLREDALRLQYYFKAVGEAIGIQVKSVLTDGSQPVGRGIGPSLEAKDVLAVLRNDSKAPDDLRERSIQLAGALLELSGKFPSGAGEEAAREILTSGKAEEKFISICKAQGKFTEPESAPFSYDVLSTRSGTITAVDNRKLARTAKLAGAPQSPTAGLYFNAPLGKKVKAGELLFTIYADASGELEYAKEYLQGQSSEVITIL